VELSKSSVINLKKKSVVQQEEDDIIRIRHENRDLNYKYEHLANSF
jgi:hypothetical protein